MTSTLSLKNCPQCGSENLAAARFCSDCGRPFVSGSPAVTRVEASGAQSGPSSRWDLGTCIDQERQLLKTSTEAIPRASGTAAAIMRSLESIPESATEARIALIQALGETRDPGVLRTLLLCSSARFKEVRKAAAIALSRIRHPLACYLLLPLLKDKSSRVRSAALQALLNQRDSRTLSSIVASCLAEREQRISAKEALHRLRPDLVNSFLMVLQNRFPQSSEVLSLCQDFAGPEFAAQIGETARFDNAERAPVTAVQPCADTNTISQPLTSSHATDRSAFESKSRQAGMASVPADSAAMSKNQIVAAKIDASNEASVAAKHADLHELTTSLASANETELETRSEMKTPSEFEIDRTVAVSDGSRSDALVANSGRSNAVEFDRQSNTTGRIKEGSLSHSGSSPRVSVPAGIDLNDESFADLSFFESLTTSSFSGESGPSQEVSSRREPEHRVSSNSSIDTGSMNLVNTASGEIPLASSFAGRSSWSSASHLASPSELSGWLNHSHPAAGSDRWTLPGQAASPPARSESMPGHAQGDAALQRPFNSGQRNSAQRNSGPFDPAGTSWSGGSGTFPSGSNVDVSSQVGAERTRSSVPASSQQFPPGAPLNVGGMSNAGAMPWPSPPMMMPTIVPVPQYLQPPVAVPPGAYPPVSHDSIPSVSGTTQQTSSDTIHRITLPPAEPEAPVISQTPAAPPPVIATETDESAEKADQERRLQRLRDARDKAFRQLLKLEEEPIPAVPRLLSRRIATLLSTPSKQHDKICEQLEELGKSAHTSVIETISSFTHKPVKEVRLACARALGHIRHPDSSVQLLKMLGDKSGTVAEAALKSLLSQPLKELYPVILSAGLVTSGMKAIVVSGIESLESDQKSAWEQFFLAVQSTPDQELQAFALSLLARITGSAHYELFRTLVSHEAAELRAAAIEAMARTEEKRSMSHINEGLQDVDPEVRNQAVLALNVMHSPRSIELLSKLFTDPVVSVRRNAAIVASRIEEEGLADAAAAALDRERDPDTVEALLACLSRNAATVGMNVLTQYAEDRQSPFRDLAIRALRKQKNPESIPAFVRLLDDLSSAVRRQAVEHLGAVRHIPVAAQIRELLKRDPDETVRAACAKALGDFGDAGSLQPLEEALEDHALVRLQAVIALGRLGQAAAAPSLLSLFADAQPEIRYQAVRAIGALKLDDTIRHVEPLLDDKDELVRRGAEQTLTELGVPVSIQKRQRLKKRLVHLAVNFIPPYLAGSVPGGGGALLATVATVLLLSVSWGLMKIKSVTAAEDFHIGPVASVALNPDASQLAVTRSSGVMELWKTDDGTLQYRVSAPKDANRLFFDKSGAILYAAGKQIVRKTDAQLKEGQEGQSIELPSAPAAVVQHSQSDSLYVFLRNGNGITLRKIACETLKDVGQFALDKPYKGLCLVSPDEAMAAMVDPDGNLHLFDLKTGKSATVSISRMTKQKRLGRVRTVIFSPDMKHIAISAEDMGLVVLDLKSLKLLKHVTKRGIADYIDGIFPDENTFLCVATDGAVLRLSNNFADEDLSQVKGLPNAEIVSIAANQKSVAIGHPEEKSVWILSVAEKKIAREIAPEND